LKLEEIEVPRPTADQVLVRVAAAGINPVDYKIREGHFPKITERNLPLTLGRDVCGTIEGPYRWRR
jgi:NADPH:quinone reductase-like Zn-dependent oxidoreductase